jgi:amino acid transporter
MDPDTLRLHELGYAQELDRKMGGFSNFAVSFSIISILTGGITTYYLGMDAGGPLVITIGWLIVGLFTLMVGMSMAEITSAYPTAGGLYYWSAKLAKKNSAAWSWTTGWFNLIGQVAVTASIDFGLAYFVLFFIQQYSPTFGTSHAAYYVFGIYLIILLVHGTLNTFGVNLIKVLADISVWWHLLGTAIIVGVLFIAPSHHLPVNQLISWNNGTNWGGPHIGVYVFLIGLLLAQYTLTGYDASAHMTEETHKADTAPSRAILRAIYVSIAAAFVLNLAMTLALPSVGTKEYNAIAVLGTTAGGQVMINAVGGFGGKLLVLIAMVAMFFCGLSSVTANSRMVYAFSRDGAVPGSKLWSKVNPRTKTPTNSVWFAAAGAALLGLPSLYQHGGASIAFFAVVSIGTVGLYIAYAIPIFLRIRSKTFVPGPWNLGSLGKAIGWIAVIWVAIITLLFFAPQFYPFWGWANVNNFNWAAPVFIVLLAIIGLWWALSARKWFKGPIVMGDEFELEAIEEAEERAAHEG